MQQTVYIRARPGTLSPGPFAVGVLFLWTDLLFRTDTEREATREGLQGLARAAAVCTVPSLGLGASF